MDPTRMGDVYMGLSHGCIIHVRLHVIKMTKEVMDKCSTTFACCTKAFPAEVRRDVYSLYGYIRHLDNIVDGDELIGDIEQLAYNFAYVNKKYDMPKEWKEDFYTSMRMDAKKVHHDDESMLRYCRGSAEVIGLMMARILGAPESAYPYAEHLGRAYQIINFVRDYDEDIARGYHYIGEDLNRYLDMFEASLFFGERGIKYLPRKVRKPIRYANEMYRWCAKKLRKGYKNPKPNGWVRAWIKIKVTLW